MSSNSRLQRPQVKRHRDHFVTSNQNIERWDYRSSRFLERKIP